jgi:hypothetical protein
MSADMRKLALWLLYPAIFAAVLAATLLLLVGGLHEGWPLKFAEWFCVIFIVIILARLGIRAFGPSY